ncbi:MAG: hypothetical protein ACLR1D_05540 [Dialister sp.]
MDLGANSTWKRKRTGERELPRFTLALVVRHHIMTENVNPKQLEKAV